MFYVAVMLSTSIRQDYSTSGILVGLVFICSWGCDTCAYCVGMLIGKHKMAPKLSPKKSVEGIGGIVGAVLWSAHAAAINYFRAGCRQVHSRMHLFGSGRYDLTKEILQHLQSNETMTSRTMAS
ncbi:MAG: phosphatidate cytidylyltransferase [Faecalimonas umbilicata]